MTGKKTNQTGSSRILYWVKGYIYLTATTMALGGAFLCFKWWSTRNMTDWWLGASDPLLGISNRSIVAIGGVLQFATATYMFIASHLLNRTLAVLWLGFIHLIYYAAIRLTAPAALLSAERFWGWQLQIQPGSVDARWKFFQFYFLGTSVVVLVLIWYHSKKHRNEAWFEHWLESRAQSLTVAPGRSINSSAGEKCAKTICSDCGQKIGFPISRAGEIIACPNCGVRITLREPSTPMHGENGGLVV